MRKVNGSASTIVTFIAPDDDAISSTEEDAYEQYLTTADVSHLKLNGEPARYYMRLLSTKTWQRLTSVFRLISDTTITEGEATPTTPADVEEAFNLELNVRMAYSEIIKDCVIGCKNHPQVTAINDDGSFEYKMYDWPAGTRAPEGVIDSIIEDTTLVSSMITYLMRISSLTETEKNR